MHIGPEAKGNVPTATPVLAFEGLPSLPVVLAGKEVEENLPIGKRSVSL